MVPFEIIWELLSSKWKDTEFWPAIVGSTAIVIALGILLRKIKMIWRKVGAAAAALGLLAAWDGFCLNWHSLPCYRLAGLLFALSALCFLAPHLWSRHRLRSVKELCKQQAYVEALELLSTVKEGWLSSKQLQGYQKRMFFCLSIWETCGKQVRILREYGEKRALFAISPFILWHFGPEI